MKQEDWDAAIAQTRAKMGRLAERAEAMTDDEYKDFKVAEMERQRFVQIENIEDMARTPNDVYAAKLGITEDAAATMLQPYRDADPEAVFERQLQALRETPAAELKAHDLVQLRRMATGTGTTPVPEHVG